MVPLGKQGHSAKVVPIASSTSSVQRQYPLTGKANRGAAPLVFSLNKAFFFSLWVSQRKCHTSTNLRSVPATKSRAVAPLLTRCLAIPLLHGRSLNMVRLRHWLQRRETGDKARRWSKPSNRVRLTTNVLSVLRRRAFPLLPQPLLTRRSKEGLTRQSGD